VEVPPPPKHPYRSSSGAIRGEPKAKVDEDADALKAEVAKSLKREQQAAEDKRDNPGGDPAKAHRLRLQAQAGRYKAIGEARTKQAEAYKTRFEDQERRAQKFDKLRTMYQWRQKMILNVKVDVATLADNAQQAVAMRQLQQMDLRVLKECYDIFDVDGRCAAVVSVRALAVLLSWAARSRCLLFVCCCLLFVCCLSTWSRHLTC
jgi:hypothetical protein